MSRRRNGEGSIYQVPGGWRGYVWCTRPDGIEYRKYCQRTTYDDTRKALDKLREEAARGPVASDVPRLAEFIAYWLKDIVEPNLAPKTYEKYEMFSRLHIIPHLGGRRLDKIQVKDIRQWTKKLAVTCQCCAQEKMQGASNRKGAAAPSGNVATKPCLPAAGKTPAIRSAPHFPARSKTR